MSAILYKRATALVTDFLQSIARTMLPPHASNNLTQGLHARTGDEIQSLVFENLLSRYLDVVIVTLLIYSSRMSYNLSHET